jgi:TetR/AcrR family transcriptional repressor of nem operon
MSEQAATDGSRTARSSPVRERILDAASRLIMEEGFSATSVDAVLAAAGASKGAFFHHFPSKDELGCAVVSRYAADDIALIERLLGEAEDAVSDPAEQYVHFLRAYEEVARLLPLDETGCLFASFVYDRLPADAATREVIADATDTWRKLVRGKVETALAARPPAVEVDAAALTDHLFVAYEGGLVMARITGEQGLLSTQLAQYRRYVELLLAM